MNGIVGSDIYIGDGIKCGGGRTTFLLRKVRMLRRCSDMQDCISITLVKNVNENDYIGGKLLGSSSFGVILKETIISCSIFSIDVEVSRLISWPIKNLWDLFICVMFFVEVSH